MSKLRLWSDFQFPWLPVVNPRELPGLGLPHRERLFVEIKLRLGAHGYVSEDADSRRSHQILDIADGLLPALDAIQEVFPVSAGLTSLWSSGWAWTGRHKLDRLDLGPIVGIEP